MIKKNNNVLQTVNYLKEKIRNNHQMTK